MGTAAPTSRREGLPQTVAGDHLVLPALGERREPRREPARAHVRKSYQIHVSNMRTSMSGTFVKCPSNESNVAPDSTTHYDGGNENLLDILQHPCYRLVAIQERDYCV